MQTYYQNGTTSDVEYILSDEDEFAVQVDLSGHREIIFYRGDKLVRDIENEVMDVDNKFISLYFSDLKLYYKEISLMPSCLLVGGHSSDNDIDKDDFLSIKHEYETIIPSLNKHIYVQDCINLIGTIHNLLDSIEYCYTQFYRIISQLKLADRVLCENGTMWCSVDQSTQLMFFVETFFTKAYSILDIMVKIVWELKKPVSDFSTIVKLNCSEKLWGDRKKLDLKNLKDSIFEDCEVIRQIESLRNEVVHNGTWEFRPKLFYQIKDKEIKERYMLFPDFTDGRLTTIKNRKRFFSKGTKINDVLITIHDEFYRRLLVTFQYINSKDWNDLNAVNMPKMKEIL